MYVKYLEGWVVIGSRQIPPFSQNLILGNILSSTHSSTLISLKSQYISDYHSGKKKIFRDSKCCAYFSVRKTAKISAWTCFSTFYSTISLCLLYPSQSFFKLLCEGQLHHLHFKPSVHGYHLHRYYPTPAAAVMVVMMMITIFRSDHL